MRIVVADDHALMRRGIRDLVALPERGWTVVGEASSGTEAVCLVNTLQPDIAILDFAMPGCTGPEAATAFAEAAPSTRTIVLTMHDCGDTLTQVLQCGAYGYVLKSEADETLLQAVQAVSEGCRFFHAGASTPLFPHFRQTSSAASSRDASLTQRETEIVKLLAGGFSSKEVASLLDIGTRTVETHRLNVYRKLRLRNVADLVLYAVRSGVTPVV